MITTFCEFLENKYTAIKSTYIVHVTDISTATSIILNYCSIGFITDVDSIKKTKHKQTMDVVNQTSITQMCQNNSLVTSFWKCS